MKARETLRWSFGILYHFASDLDGTMDKKKVAFDTKGLRVKKEV